MASPRVFLSHNQKDERITERLSIDLKRAGVAVWVDIENRGGNFLDAINAALANCDFVVLVLSTDAIASEWVQHELSAAIVQKHQRRIDDILLFKVGPTGHEDLVPTVERLPCL
jgi:TIR domain-containing protein